MKIAKRAANLQPSVTLAISSMAKKMRSEGIDVVGFGAGEPDFDTPDNIKQAAHDALDAGFTKYTPATGIDELKEAIVKKLADENGLEYAKENIIVSCGGKHSLYNLMMVLFEEGDEVIIPAPYWVSYPPQVELAGAKPVIVDTEEADNFLLTPEQLEKAITPATRGLIMNSPSNPTGGAYTKEDLEGLAEVLRKHPNVAVISDDIYERLIYDDMKFYNLAMVAPDLKDRVIIVNGCSKTYSMTGWRIGYLAAAKEIAGANARLQSQSTSNPTSFAQKGAVEAIAGPQDAVAKMVVEFDKRRLYMHERLNSFPGVKCFKPQGAFYTFPNVSALFGKKSANGLEIKTASDVAKYLLEDYQVALVPGEGFGAPDNIRLSYALSMADIEKGLDRIEKAFKALG
jgi:aspartate aminotransferase